MLHSLILVAPPLLSLPGGQSVHDVDPNNNDNDDDDDDDDVHDDDDNTWITIFPSLTVVTGVSIRTDVIHTSRTW